MRTRYWPAAAVAAVLIMAAGVSTTDAFSVSRVNHLTFTSPVALPGVVLPQGTYVFEALRGSARVVRVSAQDGRPYFMAFTRPAPRSEASPRKPVVVFEEAAAGSPPTIAVWYPTGSTEGYEFVYDR